MMMTRMVVVDDDGAMEMVMRMMVASQLPLPQELTSTIDLHQNNIMADVNAPVEQALELDIQERNKK
ncbi:hypothetical protein Tco_0232502 [Tanacetum coccineum]